MAGDIIDEPLRASAPRELFAGAYLPGASGSGRQVHVGPDRRFVMMKAQALDGGQPTDEPFVVVLNWFQELRAHLGKWREGATASDARPASIGVHRNHTHTSGRSYRFGLPVR
jgi:hypothetical protein